ncbi:J domain-containing protein [Vibrio crassostreae]|uniref:J domain-containing protein n=1 Tax=Vibrio crassostreae TaxID=246167 RepID=UPI00160898AE|nr:J domain-containing protein [Vibrio crassostreae]
MEYVEDYNDGKSLVDIELKNGCFNTDSLDPLIVDESDYKAQRAKAEHFLENHNILNFFRTIDLKGVNKETAIDALLYELHQISSDQKAINPLSKWVTFLTNKTNTILAYLLVAGLSILVVKSNGYILFWYNYVMTLMFGYIAIEQAYKYAKKQVDGYDRYVSEQNLLNEKNTRTITSLTNKKFDYLTLRAIAVTLLGPEFKRRFGYVKFSDTSSLNKVDSYLLDKANDTIKSANKRISQLKFDNLKIEENFEKLTIEKNSTLKLNAELNVEINRLKQDIHELKESSASKNACPYETLGARKGERDIKVIKANYKRLSNIYHYDRTGSNTIMKQINVAYDQLVKICKC